MLPACRTTGEGFAIPTFDLTPAAVEGFPEELWDFQSALHDCFTRSEARTHFFDYMMGQLSPLERKSIEPMAFHIEGGTICGLQRFISDVPWDEEQMRWNYHQLVAEAMGDPEGVLIVDETGFVKKGKESVGVARQYCGTLGKVANCQVGVFASYASPHGYALVDKCLFLPEAWWTETYATRRTRCHVPYGNSPDFWDAIDRCVGVTAFVAIPADTRCWLHAPRTMAKTYTYQGAVRSKRVVGVGTQEPCTVMAVAASLPALRWYRRTVSEGTKGPIISEFTRQRITLCKDGLPERAVWLVVKRTIGGEPTSTYSISNAPVSTPLRTLVWLSGVRWAIEPCFAEGKTALGMDHYEGRKYPGWHHHMLMTMLAHFFLWHLQICLREKSAGIDRSPDPEIAGGHCALPYVDDCRGARWRGLGPTAPSRRVSRT
jgi:SRSO17 transposase